MAASSSTAPFSLDLYHNGYFKLKPLTYIDSEMVTINIDVTGFKFEDMKEYIETKTHSLVSGLYYFNKDHRNADLGEYIGKDLGDTILVELKPAYDFNDSDDEFSDVASLDHLSEGEEELRDVRIKKRKSVEEKNKSNEDEDDESRLVLHNDSDDNDHEVDPLFSNLDDDSLKEKVHVEPEINSDEDMPIMDGDEIVYDPNKRDYSIHDPNTHWKLKKPILGDSEKLLVRCGFDEKERRKKKLPRDPNKPCCPFRLSAVKMHDGNSWHIRTLVDEHTCTRQYYLGCLVTSKWIARQYEDKIRMNPDLKVVDLQEMVMKKYRVKTSYNQCSGARRIAVYNLKQNVGSQYDSSPLQSELSRFRRSNCRGVLAVIVSHLALVVSHSIHTIYMNVGSQYDRLVDYAGELRKTNPGTTVHLCIDPLADAIGRDGNNQIYPIAWAVVQVESTETWEWFVKLLTKDLGLADGHGITFISDGHKGLIQAVRRVVPRVEHRLCARHIYANFNKFEVRQGNGIEAFSVDLEKRECSCRQWQLTGVPCPHSITAMYFINTNPDDYVSESFKVSTYKSIYAFNILPVDGINMWRKIKHVPCKPPLERRMPGRPPVNRKKDKSEMKIQKHVARPPRSMTCKNCGETGHNKNDCEKPKVHGEEANPGNEQANPPSQQAGPPKKKGRPMVNDPVNARVTSQSKYNFVTARGGIWMGGTSASGSSKGRGNASGSSRGRGSASGSNRGRRRARGSNKVVVTKPVVERYILLDEDDLVDIQVEEEVDTRYENVASEAAEQDEKKDEAARLKKRTRHIL
ncbi:cellulose synthase [Tanacetum coccineum]|uniref:Cellulose synthase n=1 Tax=Tanacetum coccineum TaxID=301880 RepID=A0ABQ5GCR9_9ASTR